MSILSRYLVRQILNGLFLTFSIIISLVVLVDYVEMSRQFNTSDQVSAIDVLRLTLLKLPSVIEKTLPFIVLFGVMWSMFRLNRRSELIAMRAAGQSAWKFASPAALIAFCLGIFGTTILNPSASTLNAKFDHERIELSRKTGTFTHMNRESIWLREAVPEGSLIIHARDAIARDGLLFDVTFYYYATNAKQKPIFLRRLNATQAQLHTGSWRLSNVLEYTPHGPQKRYKNLDVISNLDPGSLLEYLAAASSLSFWDLPGMIKNTKAAKLESRRYELQWNRLLALPLTLAAMAIIGAAFSLSLVRLGGSFRMIVTGGTIGFALYFAGDVLEALGASRVLPPILAIWAAPAFVFFAGLARITIAEDG